MEDVLAIGSRLRKLREREGYTQREFSQMLNISRTSLTMWETDVRQPSYTTLLEVAGVLGVDPAWLAFGSGAHPLGPHDEDGMPVYRVKWVKQYSTFDRFFKGEHSDTWAIPDDLVADHGCSDDAEYAVLPWPIESKGTVSQTNGCIFVRLGGELTCYLQGALFMLNKRPHFGRVKLVKGEDAEVAVTFNAETDTVRLDVQAIRLIGVPIRYIGPAV